MGYVQDGLLFLLLEHFDDVRVLLYAEFSTHSLVPIRRGVDVRHGDQEFLDLLQSNKLVTK